jgi:DNA-directed RNA polymerase specialized sigma24 family protein
MRGKFGAIILTDQQEAWLLKHFKHTKNEDIAKKLGVSPRSVNRLAEKRGLTKSRQFIRKTQLDAAAAANKSNRINGTYPPKGYQIPNKEKGYFKKGEKPIDRLGAKREAERIAKSVQSRKETFKLEKARAIFGLPRQTKMKVVLRPRRQVRVRYYLRKRGYTVERGSNVAYYNSQTQRSLKMETNPPAGFSFLEQS